MKIIVGAKMVVDSNIKVRTNKEGTDVDILHNKMSLNPFDENAIEEAVKLKENNLANQVIAVSIGDEKCIDILRIALAKGVDRAILVKTNYKINESIIIARIYRYLVNKEQPDLIILGKQAIDDDSNQVGQMLAGMLNYPQGTFISKLIIKDNKLIVDREIENGIETLVISLPAVLTVDLHINKPKFIKLPQLILAKKKNIEIINIEETNTDIKNKSQILKVSDGEEKRECVMINKEQLLNIVKNLSSNGL